MKHSRFIALLLALALTPAAVQGTTETARSLAYDMHFVWHLAARHGKAWMKVVLTVDPSFPADSINEFEDQLTIVSYHYLIKCGGPLPRVAAALTGTTWQSPPPGQAMSPDLLAIADQPQVEAILTKWSRENMRSMLQTFSRGRYGFHPECIDAGFLAQNPHLPR